MPSTEDRIVKIEFDNGAFEQKVGNTLLSLAGLEKAMKFENGLKGFADLNTAASNVNLAGMASGIDTISNKFTAMGAVGFSVIQSLTQSALGFAKQVGGDIFGPIFEGGLNRSKAMEQAKFMFQGLGIDVEQGMASAKAAVLGTAYGLGDAAKVAAQFGASGIQVGEDMTGALRGVAGAAAMTGSSFADIGYIFTGIAGQGKVNSQDLMQFSTRGLNAAAAMGKVMGITEQQVRDMVSNGELDFATFARAMDDAFGAHAQAANETFVGSLANMKAALGRLGAAFIAPELTNFRDIFNAITPQIDAFTAAIKPAIDTVSLLAKDVTGKLVDGIKGINFDSLKAAMPDVVTGMVNIFRAIQNIWNIGKQAFEQIFPPGAVSTIQKIASAFREFSEHIQVSVGAMNTIRSIFEGVFSALSIGWEVIKQTGLFFLDLGKSIAGIFGPGLVSGFAKIGDFLTGMQDSLVKGGGIKSFFEGLRDSLEKPLEFLEKIKDAISNLFSGFNKGAGDTVKDTVDGLSDKFGALKDRLKSVWDPFLESLGKIKDALTPIAQEIGDWFSGLWDKLAEGLTSGDFNNILDAINVGLLGGIAALLAKFLKGGFNINFIPGIANLGGTLQQLTNTLSGMQTVLKSEALMKIAEAIGLLTISVVALSMIDSGALTKALTAMSVGFGELIGAFAALEKLSVGPKGALDFTAITVGLNLLAGAMIGMAIAVAILSTLDWDALVKGLGGVLVLLGGLSLAVKPLSANSEGMIAAGFAIGEIAAGMLILALAVKIMGSMSWEELAKGLIGVAVGLGAIVLALNLMPNDLAMVKAGISIMAIATAMVILGGAMAIFGSMNWETLAKGLVGFGVGLGGIVLAVNLMPKDMGASAASILLVSIAIVAMAVAMQMISNLSWEEIAKGLVGIAVSLALLVGASLLMEAAIPGAGAMVLVAGALLILAQAITTIGAMSWEDLVKALVGLALGIGLIAAAAILLTPAIPEIMALGVALIFLGAGIALIGAGALLLAKAFEIIATASEQAIINLPKVLEAIGSAIPSLLKGIAEGIVDMIQVFTDAAPSIMKAVGIFLTYLIDTLIKLSPKLMQLLRTLLDDFITLIYEYTEPLVAAGMHIIISFLQGISDNIEQVVTIVASIITKFLDAFTAAIPGMVDSLVNLITTLFLEVSEGVGEIAGTLLFGMGIAFMTGFLNGLENSLGPVISWFGELAGKVLGWIGDTLGWLVQKGSDLLTGLVNGIVSGATAVWNWFTNLPTAILNLVAGAINWLVQTGSDILTGLKNGIESIGDAAIAFIGTIPQKVLDFLDGAINWLVQAGSDILTGLKNGIEAIGEKALEFLSSIHSKVWDFFSGAWDWLTSIGHDIMQGLWNGLKAVWENLKNWLGSLPGKIKGFFEDALDILSPSRVMKKIGQNIMLGLHIGMSDQWDKIDSWLTDISPLDDFTNSLSKTISQTATKISDLPEFQPTITPVLDLTRVAEDAGKIGDYINGQKVAASISFNNAQLISASQNGSKFDTPSADNAPREIQFNQTINAPTQLSAADIYKNTRNQITMAKEELSIP